MVKTQCFSAPVMPHTPSSNGKSFRSGLNACWWRDDVWRSRRLSATRSPQNCSGGEIRPPRRTVQVTGLQMNRTFRGRGSRLHLWVIYWCMKPEDQPLTGLLEELTVRVERSRRSIENAQIQLLEVLSKQMEHEAIWAEKRWQWEHRAKSSLPSVEQHGHP